MEKRRFLHFALPVIESAWRETVLRLPTFPPPWYERVVNGRPFQFEWDEVKADANARRHAVTFELASTVFFDPNLLTVAD
jgi:hypothetical protein